MSRSATTRPTPKAAPRISPSTPLIHPGCLIAFTIWRLPPLCPSCPYRHRVRLRVLDDRILERFRHFLFKSLDPFPECRSRLDDDFGPHRGVAEAAELGADQLVVPFLVRGHGRRRRDTRDRV